jgi:hypothetical protein
MQVYRDNQYREYFQLAALHAELAEDVDHSLTGVAIEADYARVMVTAAEVVAAHAFAPELALIVAGVDDAGPVDTEADDTAWQAR